MRCDCCPLRPIYDDDCCSESEGEYGIEHADGMCGCKHPRNWAEKRSNELDNYYDITGTDMGIEMMFSAEELKQVIELCEHMVGLDNQKPYSRVYHRHGKAFYKAYRNYYTDGISGNPLLDKLCGVIGIMRKEQGRIGTLYALTQYGLKWLGRWLNITIKDEEEHNNV